MKMKMTPTTLDRKARKKWLISPVLAIVLALLLVLSSLSVYAGEQQNEQSKTPSEYLRRI
jgi:cytochrome c-type biogenesis protein CcmH/NrfG